LLRLKAEEIFVFFFFFDNMSFHLGVNETNDMVFIQQHNYIRVYDNIIKVRHAFSEDGVYEFSFTGRIVDFTVPITGIYKIEAWGARGGTDSSFTGPLGAYSKSYVLLNKDEAIQILVGEKGFSGHGSDARCGGGGGGTFIARGNAPLCVAGGGGGFAYNNNVNTAIQSHACGQSTQLSANFGTGQASLKMGGFGGTNGGGGGGLIGNGGDGSNLGKGGISFLNGGARQTQGTYRNSAYGGFGGGGSRHGYCGYASGGGGYTGGSACQSDIQGGGGGSYFEGNLSSEALSFAISGCDSGIPQNPGTSGNGFAILTYIKSISNDVQKQKVSCYIYRGQFLWTLYATLISQ
jgi:hypothetical protein